VWHDHPLRVGFAPGAQHTRLLKQQLMEELSVWIASDAHRILRSYFRQQNGLQ
jgi:hypothetical protein